MTYGIVQCGPDYPDGIPYIRPVDMTDEGGVQVDSLQHTTPEIAAAYARSTVRPGDIVVSIGPSFGKAMIVPSELDGANLTQGTARLAPGRDVLARFLFWALRSESSRMAWDSFCSGATFRALTLEILETCEVALPASAEQRAIAAFLDRETSRIDALVAKKERLIELLQEQRTAHITRAVTKGLDPTVPMKDSGVEWLGEIPAHWEVSRIKWAAQMVSGHTPDKKIDSYWQGGDIPWVSLADTGQLREVDYIAATAAMTTSDGIAHSSAHVLPEGTVVFSRDATIGLCAVTRAGMAVSQHFIGWVCGSRLRPEYLLFVLRSMTQELERLTMGATVRTIGMPDVKSLATPIPPLAEQEHIVREVLHHRARIDDLVAKIRDAIARLKELRTALVSAAVTGKIDVREDSA
ncbi:MAG TPA: restriction endonuclease subunit S [Planctomycetota bacterium]|nr:restriction endonuclease subunit S [Planctomycetota bacterium]